jgi:hypothetical protein
VTEPPQPPEPGEFAEFFHTDEIPDKAPRSHRATPIETSPFFARLMAPVTAVVVVVVVIVLLIWINGGSSGNGTSPAAVGNRPSVAVTPTHASSPTPSRSRTTPARPASPTAIVKPAHHHHNSSRPTPTGLGPTSPPPTVMAPVTVLNNSRRTGLAAAVAGELRAKNWKIASVGNFHGLLPQTTLYYAPGAKRAALHLSEEFDSIQRMAPNRQGNITAGALTLVVTRYWQL